MGLNVTAYEHATLLEDHPDRRDMSESEMDWCHDEGHRQTFAYADFRESFRGLAGIDDTFAMGGNEYIGGRWYHLHGRELDVEHSYGGFGDFRNRLCVAMFEIPWHSGRDSLTGDEVEDPSCYLENLGDYQGEPFYEFLNFADNEGYIGPEAAADLAKDFAEHATVVLSQLRQSFEDRSWAAERYVDLYERWRAMFELAAGTGAVEYH